MSEGTPLRALAWGLGAGLVLLAWPWLLALVQARRPARLAGTAVLGRAELDGLLGGAVRPHVGSLLAWLSLAMAAALLPAGNGWQSADLDAGLLWLAMLAVAGVAGGVWHPGAIAAAAGGLVTMLLCVAAPVMHTASLHLGDIALAQQGGLGNWYLLRDPFLLLAGGVFLLAAASLWPPPPVAPAGLDGLLRASVHAGLPLVLAHTFTVVFLGGWWAFVPALDGLSWLQTGVKNVVVLALLILLRRRTAWTEPANLAWRLPLAAAVACAGAVIWLVASGAVL